LERLSLENFHEPVLLSEVIDCLITNKSGIYFDGTLGGGGHSLGILNRLYKNALVIGTDIDKESIVYCKQKKEFKKDKRFIPVQENYKNIQEISAIADSEHFDGILIDCGFSSGQLDSSVRGFSYLKNSILDMRMDLRIEKSGYDIINNYEEHELKRIFRDYGEIRFHSKLARTIVEMRKKETLKTTFDLFNIVKRFSSKNKIYSSASRVFQAIRIEVNQELLNLREFLENFVDYLISGGRICIISYHSLEDRMVKEAFNKYKRGCVCPSDFPICQCGQVPKLKVVTKRPLIPGEEEIERNPRARSARLRVAERI